MAISSSEWPSGSRGKSLDISELLLEQSVKAGGEFYWGARPSVCEQVQIQWPRFAVSYCDSTRVRTPVLCVAHDPSDWVAELLPNVARRRRIAPNTPGTGRVIVRQLSKADLLAEIAAEYQRLAKVLDRVSKTDLTDSRVNSAGWSLKDVLAHVADWAERCAGWCEAGLRGEKPEPPALGLKWNQFPELNQQIVRRHRHRPVDAILFEFRAGRARLCGIAERFDKADLSTPHRFDWTGPTWAVANHIRANTASHFRRALKHFRRWLRAQQLKTRLAKKTKPGKTTAARTKGGRSRR